MNLKNIKQLYLGWMRGEYHTRSGNVSSTYFLLLFCHKLKKNKLESLTLVDYYNLTPHDLSRIDQFEKTYAKTNSIVSKLTKLNSVCFTFAKRNFSDGCKFKKLKQLFFRVFDDSIC